jgi:hypothetical protein
MCKQQTLVKRLPLLKALKIFAQASVADAKLRYITFHKFGKQEWLFFLHQPGFVFFRGV